MADQRKEIAAIDETQAGVAKALKRARSSAQAQGRKEQNVLWSLFESQQYATQAGLIASLRRNSPSWSLTKARLGLDLRSGHAGLGLSKAIKSPRSFTRTDGGFIYDIRSSGLSTRKYQKRGKKQNRAVASYARHYAIRNAPGLGSFALPSKKRIRDAITASFSAALVRTKAVRKNVRTLRLDIRGLV